MDTQVDQPKITVGLSTQYYRYLELELHGEIYHQTMEIGRIHNRRFCRWRDRGIWEKLLEVVIGDPDYTWLMIDATFVKCHQHSAEVVGGNQAIGLTKGGKTLRYTWSWMHIWYTDQSYYYGWYHS